MTATADSLKKALEDGLDCSKSIVKEFTQRVYIHNLNYNTYKYETWTLYNIERVHARNDSYIDQMSDSDRLRIGAAVVGVACIKRLGSVYSRDPNDAYNLSYLRDIEPGFKEKIKLISTDTSKYTHNMYKNTDAFDWKSFELIAGGHLSL